MTCAFALCGCFRSRTQQEAVSDEIRDRILAVGTHAGIVINQDSIHASAVLMAAYKDRDYRAFWSADQGLLAQADSLVEAIKEADREGLRPEDYHLAAIEGKMGELRQSQEDKESPVVSRLADLDLMLTDAFLVYASHLAGGKVNRETLWPEWSAKNDSLDYAALLDNAVRSNQIQETLRELLPKHAFYADLRRLLSSFEVLARRGGWGKILEGAEMRVGESGKRVTALRRRLAASGDLSGLRQRSNGVFDSTLANGVCRFQMRHGLAATGVVDSATLVALNVPVELRLEQIKANMERWRWLPHKLGRKYVRVNVADFKLTAVEEDREVLSMKVVVGNPDWQTPVFRADITQVLFNDYWIAPYNILATELINYMKADSNYLKNNEMVLLRESGDSLQEVDPHTINFAELNPKDIDFKLRQGPGPNNIMGQVKFLLPNKYEVFLHDTPYREDFAKNVRMYSHGCIRLEKPFDFAEYILKDYLGWTKDTILAVVHRIERRTINLKDPIPVYVLYCTARKDKDGTIQFREDYYGKDKRLSAALLEGSPAIRTAR